MKLPWQRDASQHATGSPGGFALPETTQKVLLTMPDGERVPARVAKREGEEVLVLLMVPTRQPLSGAQLHDIVVEFATNKGLVRLAGDALLEDSDLLRFKYLQSLEILQRRDYVRVRTSRPVLVSLNGNLAPLESSSIDLSGGGMLIGGSDHLRVGTRIHFRLNTDEESPAITGDGVVVRSDATGKCAIAFDSISEGNRRRLIRFLFDCQREERAKGLKFEDENGR